MKYVGTVKSFDSVKGLGEIRQEAGGDDLLFEKSAIQWDEKVAPTVGQRLTYDRGTTANRQPCALNVMKI